MLPSLFLTAVLGAASLPVGPASLDPEKSIAQFVIDTWSMEDGLPNNAVGSLLQTSDGYLWIGTDAGLARYNGVTFTLYDRDPSFLSNEIISLAEDANGYLWAGTLKGVVLVTPQGTRRLEWLPPDVRVEALAADAQGNVYVGTWTSGVFRCSPSECELLGGNAGRIQAISRSETTTWVGSESGLFKVEADSLVEVPYDGPLVVSSMTTDATGSLLVARREGGLLHVTPEGSIRVLPETDGWPTDRVWSMMADRQGTLWFGMESQQLLRRSRGSMDVFSSEDGLPGTRVLALHEDREGSVWVGTEGGGLLRFRNGAFATIGSNAGLREEYVTTITQGEDGSMLAGTYGAGVHVIDQASLKVQDILTGVPSPNITGVLSDGAGGVYVATIDDGVTHLSNGRARPVEGLPSTSVYALHLASDGALWIGTDLGLARSSNGVTTVFSVDDGLGSNSIVDVETDGLGNVWIGTYGGGLTHLSSYGTTRIYSTANGLGSDIVSALHLDSAGALWIGTLDGGLSVLADGRIHTLSIADGLFDRSVFQILEDDLGYLWMGSNRGVTRVQKQQVWDYLSGSVEAIRVESFGTDDGLKSPEINGGAQPAGWKSRDGRLWFPTVAGVAVVDPSDLSRNTVPPPVVVERVEADGIEQSGDLPLKLPAGTRRIEFKFAALSLIDASAISYRYRLEGDEEGWNSAMAGNTATYTFLDPGTYTFHVTATNNDGVWNDQGAEITFYLAPYLWQTRWFWILVASVCFLGGAAVALSRTRHMKRQREELEAMVRARTRDVMAAKDQIQAQSDALRVSLREKEVLLREVHHRVKNNLQMISSLLQLQSRQVTDSETKLLFEECRNRIFSFSMVHERLYRAKDMAHFDFVEYIDGLTDQLVRSHDRADRDVELVTEVESVEIDVDKVIPCGLIVTEFVTNALRHAFEAQETGTIWVRFTEDEDFGVLTVEDDGLGLSSGLVDSVPEGLGLKLVDALVSRLRGEMNLNTRPGGGTKCSVRFPLGASALPIASARKSVTTL